MSLDRREIAQNASELRANFELSGLTAHEVEREPVPFTILTEQARASAMIWFELREAPRPVLRQAQGPDSTTA